MSFVSVRGEEYNCIIVAKAGLQQIIYPYLRSEHGDKTMWQVSPHTWPQLCSR